MRALRLVVALTLMVGLTGGTAAVAKVQAREMGLIRFINNTSSPLTFSVDGDEETCRATQNRECNVRYEVGEHSLFAEYDNGKSHARRVINLTSAGFTWTVR